MAEALALIYVLLAAPLVIAALWFFAEVAASRSTASVDDPRRAPGPIAVVIPAHNEESVLAATLVNLQPQLRPADRLVVVADNCTDQTAEVARQHGAEVLVRTNSALRGKGYALQHGLDHLRKDPPQTVIFTDADCQHTDGLIPSLARITEITNAPVQPLYAMHAPEGSGPARAVAEFAWLLMNEVRIQGLFRLTGGTRITGAGQAFPWAIAETLNLASGEIVEDTALTLDLAKRGIRTRYVAEHRVSSTFPVDDEAAVVQRARWEHGSLSIQRRVALPLLIEALRTGAIWKAGMALHFLVPPLTIFAGALMALAASSLLLAPFTGWWLLFLGFGPLVLFSAGVLWAWQRSGREALPPEALRGMWPFLLSKLKVYGKDGRQTAKVWTRTPRDQQEGRS